MALAPTDIKVAGHWKSVDKASIKIGGHWKPVDQIMEKVAGHWKHIGTTLHPPLFTGAIGDLTAVVGEAFTKDVSPLFSTGPVPASYSLNNAPAGMVISNAGVISWPVPAPVPVTPPGVNLAVGGTPTESNHYPGSYAADMAFDGNPTTIWHAAVNNKMPEWISYEFLAPVSVKSFSIQARESNPDDSPENFKLQYDAGGDNWQDAGTYSNEVAWTKSEVRLFGTAGSHTSNKWRLLISLTESRGQHPTIADIKFFAEDLGTMTVTATNTGGDAVSDAFGVSAIALGPEMINNWDFSTSDLSQWTVQTNVAASVVNGEARIEVTAANPDFRFRLAGLTTGKTYLLRGSARVTGAASSRIQFSRGIVYMADSNKGAIFQQEKTATGAFTDIKAIPLAPNVGDVLYVDYLSVREVLP